MTRETINVAEYLTKDELREIYLPETTDVRLDELAQSAVDRVKAGQKPSHTEPTRDLAESAQSPGA